MAGTKYKVGDIVSINDSDDADWSIAISSTNGSDEYPYRLHGQGTTGFCEEELDLVKAKENIMSGIVKKIKDLALSAEDKLLRKYGVVDTCGELTDDGRQVLLGILLAQNKTLVVEKVKAVDLEEKQQKKDK